MTLHQDKEMVGRRRTGRRGKEGNGPLGSTVLRPDRRHCLLADGEARPAPPITEETSIPWDD
jgi:hypothetical protein